VLGIDVTPAMVWSAGAAADKAGLGNVSFTVGDAVASGLEAASFDGAVTRFSVHHVPVPARLVAEMARVVRPGGAVVVCDHVADDDADAVAWSQEIERLRDPSHWASLPVSRLRALGAGVPGLTLEDEALADVELDYEDWLARGSGGVAARTLIDGALAAPPAAAACFGWRDGAATLGLRVWMGRWRVLGGDG
jgi:SAM-dependent methyltransferase